MLRNVKDLRGYAIRATDGVIGKVDDFYFDDEDWGIRYLIVKTGSWLFSRKVLISPVALGHAGWMARELPVALTRAQVERSPHIDTRKPVSRQQEAEYLAYYGYPFYWGGWWPVGSVCLPAQPDDPGRINRSLKVHATHGTGTLDDCHLRSCSAVIGHHLEATDGRIGHVEDMLVDDYTWAVRYLIVSTSNWVGAEELIVPPHWITQVSWPEKQVHVAMTRQAVKDAPHYFGHAQADRPEKRQA